MPEKKVSVSLDDAELEVLLDRLDSVTTSGDGGKEAIHGAISRRLGWTTADVYRLQGKLEFALREARVF